MARAAYGLNEYATSTIRSMNGTIYTMTLWWNGTGASNTWTLGPSGAEISYESEKVDDKNSPILTSKCTIPVMVENDTQQNFIDGIRTSKQEKDVWVTIRVGASGSYLWMGYVIMDLETREDVSYPYETTLTAIDGLATLKEVPFIRETNSSSGATPTFPYERADTFDNAGFQTIIGSTSSWIKILLDYVGQILDTDDTGGALENYTIQTSFNWWNEDMGVSPSATEDPLANMKISMRPFYSKDENGYYDVPNVYQVLEDLCNNFNMRLVYWQHRFHFIQIDEYNTDEQASAPYSPPINIPTREYFYTGGIRADRNYVGDVNYSLYKMVFENATSVGTGLQKLAGSTYQGLPAIKTVKGNYAEQAGANMFTGFPLFVTHNLVSGLPTAWDTSGNVTEYLNLPQSGAAGSGVYESMLITDAKDLSGFICRIYGDFQNTTTDALKMEVLWAMRAKPSSSAWGDGDNKTLIRKQYSNYAELEWQSYEFPLANNQQYIYDQIWIPATSGGAATTRVEIFNSSTSQTTNTVPYGGNNAGVVPTHADFVGEWEFQFFTFTEYDSNATYPMRASTETANYSHGRVVQLGLGTGQLNYDGSTTAEEKVPTSYQLNYWNANDPNYPGQEFSIFKPVTTGEINFGTEDEQIEVTQDSSDTFVYNIGKTIWGDGSGSNTSTTIQVLDGSGDWVFVDEAGKWAKGVYTWGGSSFSYASPTYDQTILKLLTTYILYNQSKSILTFNTTSALSETDKYYSGTTKEKFMNPIAKLNDVDGKEYMMMRSTWSLTTDEWNGDFVQVTRSTPTITTGTRDLRGETT